MDVAVSGLKRIKRCNMLVKKNKIKNTIRKRLLNLFYKLENYNNCDIKINGETVFIENLFKFYSKKGNNDLILFDIGANIGDYTQFLLENADKNDLKPLIYSFEPTKSCFEILQNKYSNNNNVLLFSKAISEDEGEAEIYYDEDTSHLASLYKRELNYYSICMDKCETISMVRLDNFIEQNNLKHINFIKIDTEGNELSVLKSLGKYLNPNYIDFIQFEYGGTYLDSRISLRENFELLEKAGFKVAKIMKNGLELKHYEPWMDNFQYSNYIAFSPELNIK